ncbi:MAG: response regulator transcription factor [Magnetovibrionaceae bacterium]
MGKHSDLRVLIIDDLASMRALTRSLVEKFGASVVGEAKDGEEGFALFASEKPDVVLLDIEMPKQDGVATLNAIMETDPTTAVIMLTSVSDMKIAEDCLLAGARDFIRKDVPSTSLQNRLTANLKKLV